MKIRCSSLGHIMTNSRKKGELSKTAQSCVQQIMKERVFGVKTHFSSKYTDKGLIMEDAAIDLVAERYGFMELSKNEEHFSNKYITGTPDIITGESNMVVRDIKCSWSLDTFPYFSDTIPNKDYYWQLMGYMALTGARTAYLDYCLVDTPEYLIERELSTMAYRMGAEGVSVEAEAELRHNLTFSDLIPALTVKTFEVAWDEDAWEAIKTRVDECNEYADNWCNRPLNNFIKSTINK